MPVLSLGGMRQQESWNPKEGTKLEDINKEVQKNFEKIVERSMQLGINHFETARGYGTSELQYGPILKKYSRESYILQTKVVPNKDPQSFRQMLAKSFEELQLNDPAGYVDLFSFHGVNKPCHLEWIKEGCYSVVQEYVAAGKIKHVGFSTHGMAPFIVQAIETGLFSYVNLHYHWCGSYTASGSGNQGGNATALEAAMKHDMGVFIISPTDKGGALYEPPISLVKDCLPLTPIAFNDLWLWSNDSIHTLVIGAARPEDFDEHLDALIKFDNRRELTAPIWSRLEKRVSDSLGTDFLEEWAVGLPDAYSNHLGIGVGYLLWLWWIVKTWGLYYFALKRYASLEANLKTWDDEKSADQNMELFSWVPGLPYRPNKESELRSVLHSGGFTPARIDFVMNSLAEVHEWLRAGGCLARNEVPRGVDPSQWAVAYSLQPDIPYPER